jgi:hypothetical protein
MADLRRMTAMRRGGRYGFHSTSQHSPDSQPLHQSKAPSIVELDFLLYLRNSNLLASSESNVIAASSWRAPSRSSWTIEIASLAAN